jgi:hypothetical protein
MLHYLGIVQHNMVFHSTIWMPKIFGFEELCLSFLLNYPTLVFKEEIRADAYGQFFSLPLEVGDKV